MSATVVEELRRVWVGVRVDDVCAVDRVLRTGSELNRFPWGRLLTCLLLTRL